MLGLIARADGSGLANQTFEFYRHMHPDRVLVIDVGHLYNDTDHSNKRTDLSRFPGALVSNGWIPNTSTIEQFCDGLDVIFTCEEKDFTFCDREFVLAEFLVREDFLQNHAEKLAEKAKRQSGIKSTLPFRAGKIYASALSRLAFKSRLLLAPTICSAT